MSKKEKTIDITPLIENNNQSVSALKLRKKMGIGNENHLTLPDGEIEKTWDIEAIEKCMKEYLAPDQRRRQNQKRWNYAIWRYIVELYAENLTFQQIADKVSQNFECYSMPDTQCTVRTIKSIVNHRDWRIAHRLKELLIDERSQSIIGARKNACSVAQRLELDMLDDLQSEAKACLQTLRGLDPADKEYKAVVGAIKVLNSEIERISGTGSVRKIEEFQVKEGIKAEGKPKEDEPKDPKTMIPKVY